MRGFRDLDPEQAEQVVSSRSRKKEYTEERVAQGRSRAPMIYTLDTAPAEEAPRVAARPRRDYYAPEEPEEYDGPEEEYYGQEYYEQEYYGQEEDAYEPEEEEYYEPEEDGEYDYRYGRYAYEDEAYDDDRPVRRRNGGHRLRLFLTTAAIITLLIVLTAGGAAVITRRHKAAPEQREEHSQAQQGANDVELESIPAEELEAWNGKTEEEETVKSPYMKPSADKEAFFDGYAMKSTGGVQEITDEEVQSTYAVLVNAETGEIIAGRQADAVVSPASMTKILTLLVAVEHLTDLDETVTMTQEIGELVYRKDLSAVGYQVGDEIPVRDLLYGTILPSGADAAMLLAEHVAGSEEAFVEMMNDRVAEMGLSSTAHFSNPVGIYDEENHCTMKDMAMILKAAVENDLCREVLNTRIYTTAPTQNRPEGIEISNWFLRRIEDKDCHGEVICAKTGFVDQSGCCAASYQISNDGGHYLCVTGDAWSSWRAIYDHVRIYDMYTN
ncbi:MAG: D-alanyl-D-alanine carboxypeptidase [Lachnospiraceae bacterium]|nr:D-alanyl-D-alanine carboxypeptidase [Lachnospiraceae bacterium]